MSPGSKAIELSATKMDVVFLGHTQQYSGFTPGSASEITPVDVQVSIYGAVISPGAKEVSYLLYYLSLGIWC